MEHKSPEVSIRQRAGGGGGGVGQGVKGQVSHVSIRLSLGDSTFIWGGRLYF